VAERAQDSPATKQGGGPSRNAGAAAAPGLEPRPAAETILDALARAGFVFFRWDISRGLTYINAETQGLLGYTREELMGDLQVGQRIVDPSFLPALERVAPQAYEAREGPVRYEKIPFVAKSGERVWLEARVVPDLDEDGRILGFFGVAFAPPGD